MIRRVLIHLALLGLPASSIAAPLSPAQEQQLMRGAYDVVPRVSDSELINNFAGRLVNKTAAGTPSSLELVNAQARFEDIVPGLEAEAALPGGLQANTRWALSYLYDNPKIAITYNSAADQSMAHTSKNSTTGLYEPTELSLAPSEALSGDGTMVSLVRHETYHFIQAEQFNQGLTTIEPLSAFSSPSRVALEYGANTFETWDMDAGWYLTNTRYGMIADKLTVPGDGFDVANQWLFNKPGWQIKGDSQTIYSFVQETAESAGPGPFVDLRRSYFQVTQASGALEPVAQADKPDIMDTMQVRQRFEAYDQVPSSAYSSTVASDGATTTSFVASEPSAAAFAQQTQLATESLASRGSLALDASVDFAGGAIFSTMIMETLTYGFTLGSNRLFGQGLADSGNLFVQDPGKYALFSANEQYADHVAGTIADLMTAPPPQSPMDVLMMGANPMIELSDISKTVGAGVAQMLGIDVPKLQANIQGTVQLGLNELTGVTAEDDPMYIENFVHAVNVLQSQTSAETYAGLALQANQNDLFWNQMLDFRNQQMEIGQIFNSPTAWLSNEVVPNDSAAVQIAASPIDLATLTGQMTLLSTPTTPAYTGGEAFQDLNPQPAFDLVSYAGSSDTSANLVSNVAVPNGVMVSNPMLSNIGLDYRPLDTVLPISSWLPSYKAVPGVQPDFSLPAMQVGETLDPTVEDAATMAAAAGAAVAGMLAGNLSLVLNPYGSFVTNTATSVSVLGYDGSNQDDSFLGAVVPSDDSFWEDDD